MIPIRRALLAWTLLTTVALGAAVPSTPAESLAKMHAADDLDVDLALSEPEVRQPVSISFDERGRMWVVQYLQYPDPAGLTTLSHDRFWRAVYDKVPAAPPHHVRGSDKITIHEDSDGDGVYDRHKTFLDGLNIATAVAPGRGGAFVLNPPYLLFYPRAGDADTPTGDPEVLLEGFGLEDTHSVVNSLRWGPDGWLYAAQGSTVTAAVRRPGSAEPPVRSAGQLIWRYHPETRRYEVFAEGGGNAFGVEFDARGRVYSGHNGGNTRGFHYVQGGYFRKGFDKHGELSNPYTFGFFEAMRHDTTPRFTHTFAIADDGALPARYTGHLFAINPLEGRVIMAGFEPDGSTRRTRDVGPVVWSDDPRFRPVDIKFGPDGALYVADWYDGQLSHLKNQEGQVDRDTGRIYRIRTKGAPPVPPTDFGKLATRDLIDVLGRDDKWTRQTVLRLLGDRKDASAIPTIRNRLIRRDGQVALEMLWALNLCGGFDEEAALLALGHREPAVREWAIRLLGDSGAAADPAFAASLDAIAATEADVEVLAQLAATARRMPASRSLPIVARLMARDMLVADPHIPLLAWWALEARCASDRSAVVDLFAEPSAWSGAIARGTIAPRLMRRLAATGSPDDLRACARLFRLAPDAAAGRGLLEGFEAALQGRGLTGLPLELLGEMARFGGGSLALGIRLGKPDAVTKALAVVADPKQPLKARIECVDAFGEVARPGCVPALIVAATADGPTSLRSRALTALGRYDAAEIGPKILDAWPALPAEVRPAAVGLLASRREWALPLARAVEAGRVERSEVPAEVVRRLASGDDPALVAAVRAAWGEVRGATTAEVRAEIERVASVLRTSGGDPAPGKALFAAKCGACHRLFGDGGAVGPDLTAYKRDDLPSLLLGVINPNAEIREGFENHLVETADGRTVGGILLENDPTKLVLRTPDGQRVAIDRADVERSAVIGLSVMPEGLLSGLADPALRDLFAYLRGSQPIPR